MELTDEEKAECEALKRLFNERAGMSQKAFAQTYGIGNQSNVSHFLNKHQPITLDAAQKFARGLDVTIDQFSTRLARQARALARAVGAESSAAADAIDVDGDLERTPLRSMDVLELGELSDSNTSAGFVIISAPDGVPPDVPRDAIVCVNLDDRGAQDGAVVLVQTVGGTFALGVYRAVVGGFEVDTGRVVLDAQRHGLRIAGVATEMRKMLTKVTYKTT